MGRRKTFLEYVCHLFNEPVQYESEGRWKQIQPEQACKDFHCKEWAQQRKEGAQKAQKIDVRSLYHKNTQTLKSRAILGFFFHVFPIFLPLLCPHIRIHWQSASGQRHLSFRITLPRRCSNHLFTPDNIKLHDSLRSRCRLPVQQRPAGQQGAPTVSTLLYQRLLGHTAPTDSEQRRTWWESSLEKFPESTPIQRQRQKINKLPLWNNIVLIIFTVQTAALSPTLTHFYQTSYCEEQHDLHCDTTYSIDLLEIPL